MNHFPDISPEDFSLTEAEVEGFLDNTLPEWKAVCRAPEQSRIFVPSDTFATTAADLLLMGAAIHFACKQGKEVLVGPSGKDATDRR